MKTEKLTKEEILYENDEGGYAPATNTDINIFSPITINKTAKVSVSFTASPQSGYGDVKLWKDNTAIKTINTAGDYTYNVDFTAGQTSKITARCGSGASYVTWVQHIKYSIKAWEITPKSVAPAIPTEINDIGELGIVFLYGLDTNGNYRGGLIIAISNTATTGSLTLGNAVGYLIVNHNGKNYKIPYYNE